ncbi:MAG: putative flavoprotein (TIGR03862 family) [Glaciecola sp.]|jgi:uncharacterized flavoprotein (TIGR03862 family)
MEMKQKVAIVGGGTAALFLASFLNNEKFDITIYEANKSLGRKFLVAGDGGFNLTHSEPVSEMIKRYAPGEFLQNALTFFTNNDFISWLESIGINTFVGSSGRVFPTKGIKPIEVLSAIEKKLKSNKVKFEFGHRFTGWSDKNELIFDESDDENKTVLADINVFALGGGSWKVTGANDAWLKTFSKKGIDVLPFVAANCAFDVSFPEVFVKRNEGKALKNIVISCDGTSQKGEVVVTEFGLEGNAIYALSPQIQKQLTNGRDAVIEIDLKKQLKEDDVLKKLTNSGLNTTGVLKKILKLSTVQIDMLKFMLTKEEFTDHKALAKKIKKFPLTVTATAPIDEAISTTGGIALRSLNSRFELKERSNNYCIGEMVDWNAPTGGYLIQACASMGVYLSKILNDK